MTSLLFSEKNNHKRPHETISFVEQVTKVATQVTIQTVSWYVTDTNEFEDWSTCLYVSLHSWCSAL